MKNEYARELFLYRPIRAIERQLRTYADWFNGERPHEGLGLRTPDDVHHARKWTSPRRVDRCVLAIAFMDGDPRLPVFRLRKAA